MSAEESTYSAKKLELEIRKLEVEIKNARLPLYGQIINSVSVAIIAIVVLYFFQWPQLAQNEKLQTITERQQIASLLISAQSISDVREKANIMTVLSELWPDNRQIRLLSRVTETLAAVKTSNNLGKDKSAMNSAEVRYSCVNISENIAKIDKSLSEVSDENERGLAQLSARAKQMFSIMNLDLQSIIKASLDSLKKERDELLLKERANGCKR